MSRYIRTLTIIALLLPITTNGESMIGNFLKKLQTPSQDLSKGRSGIKKVGNGLLYVYKLDNGVSSSPSNHRNSALPYNYEAIDKLQQLDSDADKAVRDEKHTLYGSNKSPIKNASVMAAWERANEAKKRLDEHREYMEQVRKSRKNVAEKKSSTK